MSLYQRDCYIHVMSEGACKGNQTSDIDAAIFNGIPNQGVITMASLQAISLFHLVELEISKERVSRGLEWAIFQAARVSFVISNKRALFYIKKYIYIAFDDDKPKSYRTFSIIFIHFFSKRNLSRNKKY